MVSVRKKLHNGHIIGAWSHEVIKNASEAKGIAIGIKQSPDSCFYDGVAFLLSDETGKVYLVINEDKLKAIGGEIHIKNYNDSFKPCGITGE